LQFLRHAVVAGDREANVSGVKWFGDATASARSISQSPEIPAMKTWALGFSADMASVRANFGTTSRWLGGGSRSRVATLAVLFAMAVAGAGFANHHAGGPLGVALLFLAIAAPSALLATYLATLRRIRNYAVWSEGSLPVRWLSGPWLCIGAGAFMAIAGAVMLALRVGRFERLDWILLAATAILFPIVWGATRRRLHGQYQPVYRIGRPLWSASLITAGAMVLVDIGLRLAAGDLPDHASLRAAFEAHMGDNALLGTSSVAIFINGIGGFWAGFESFFLASIASEGIVGIAALALVALGKGALYLFVALTIAAFLVPRREYARILAPPVVSDLPPAVAPGRMGRVVSGLMILLVFAYLPGVLLAETGLRIYPAISEAPERARISVERIGDVLVREGTLRELELVRADATEQRQFALVEVTAALDAGFERMRGNADLYLDWYYSLPAEYARLASLLMGNAEELIARKLQESLGAGDPFAAAGAALAEALASDAALQAAYRERASAIIAANRIEPGADVDVETVGFAGLDTLALPDPVAFTSIGQRLGIGAAGGGMAGIASALIARRAVASLVARGSLRIAAKALQVAGGRAIGGFGGAAAGAAAGGVAGSVVPGLGTAIGALAGGIVGGLGVGLGVDYAVLKLEEALSRETNRAGIIAAIDAKEAELRRDLGRVAGAPLQ
jgi:hypothetical protein